MTVHAGDDLGNRECPACHSTVPAARFCASCGAELDAPVKLWRVLLRPRVFAGAPHEPITVPLVTSSLFIRLPEPGRKPFRLGLFLGLAALVAFPILGLLGPAVIMTALGVPLLFALYLWRSDAFRDIPACALAVAAASGAVIGVAWWLWAGAVIARSFNVSLAAGAQLQSALSSGLVITAVGALLMLLPSAVTRLTGARSGESLDGFVIGALGALCYTSTGTITWMAPQFVAGLLDNYSPWRLLEETILYGVVEPLTAAAVGGLVGLELWFRPGPRAQRHPVRMRATLTTFTVVVLAIYLAVFVVDAAQLSRAAELAINFALTALALLTLRFALQMALLHEAPDPATGQAVLCLHCAHIVPDMPFCPDCGAATRASSRTARRLRRELPA